MQNPGEIQQELGRAYLYVLVGALEATIRPFERRFYVHETPAKASFEDRSGKQYSFDFIGTYNQAPKSDVFGECKGYTTSSDLLPQYRAFVAKSYVTSVDHKQHNEDLFWFVTNISFACSEKNGLTSPEFIKKTLLDKNNADVQGILGNGHIDDGLIEDLSRRVGVFIFTDSFLKNTEIAYYVVPGESLWTILKKIHGGHSPTPFRKFAEAIATRNELKSPDHLLSGKRVRLRWKGLPA